MATESVRMLAPIPGKSAVGIEVPDVDREMVRLADVSTDPSTRRDHHPLGGRVGQGHRGRVHLRAKPLQDARIAYLPQHNYLPKGIKIKKLAQTMIDDRFWGDFSNHPIYQNYHDFTIAHLSGGELRQLETMMVLYSKADFILLDEPFTHISPIQAETFKAMIRKCATVKGVILTDHQYYNILDVSDRIILITYDTRPIRDKDELVTYGYVSHIG